MPKVKKNPYIKVKNIKASSRSLFGRSSQMDKVTEKWQSKGWVVANKENIKKNKYLLTFEYHMSDEEIAKKKRGKKRFVIVFVALLIILFALTAFGIDNRRKEAAASQTQQAFENATGTVLAAPTQSLQEMKNSTETAIVAPTLTRQVLDNTETATFWRPSNTPTARPATMYSTGNANIRSCPNTACDIIGTLAWGDEIQSFAKERGQSVGGDDLWYKFEFEGQYGYVHSSLISTSPPATAAP
jgi:hypothetical protein